MGYTSRIGTNAPGVISRTVKDVQSVGLGDLILITESCVWSQVSLKGRLGIIIHTPVDNGVLVWAKIDGAQRGLYPNEYKIISKAW